MCSAEVDRALALPADLVIPALMRLPEGQWFERKSARVDARGLAVSEVAMGNAEGGCIVVGLHDGAAESVAPARLNELRQAAMDFTRPVVRARAEQIAARFAGQDVTVLVIRVDPGDSVHETVAGDCYLRVGDESRKLGFAHRQELEFERGGSPYDGTDVAAGVSDLSVEMLEDYRNAIGSSSVAGMLAARGLIDLADRLTVAGYLLFSPQPQQLFPHANVRVLRYLETERGSGGSLALDDAGDVRCEGPIPDQIEQARLVIAELMPRRRMLGEHGRFVGVPIVPQDAWLEGLVNAVVHRSYSAAGDHIRFEIFPDRVEISSPGRFPGLVDPSRPMDIKRYARNPRIARVCSDLGVTQELGEGIGRIFAEMRARGLVDPWYQQTQSSVRLVLSGADAIPADILARLPRGATDLLGVMRGAGRRLGTGQLVELSGLARPTVLRHLGALRDAEVVAWEGQSPKDPRATWRLL